MGKPIEPRTRIDQELSKGLKKIYYRFGLSHNCLHKAAIKLFIKLSGLVYEEYVKIWVCEYVSNKFGKRPNYQSLEELRKRLNEISIDKDTLISYLKPSRTADLLLERAISVVLTKIYTERFKVQNITNPANRKYSEIEIQNDLTQALYSERDVILRLAELAQSHKVKYHLPDLLDADKRRILYTRIIRRHNQTSNELEELEDKVT